MRNKILFAILLVLCAIGAHAQGIKVGDRFFDGLVLYTVEEIRMDKYVYMVNDAQEEMTLEKVDGQENEYMLIPSRQADEPPYDVEFGARVKHVQQEQDGVDFLAILNDKGEARWVLNKTTYSMEECLDDQEGLKEDETADKFFNRVVNTRYFQYISREELEFIRHSIEESGIDNIITRTNLELIRNEEAQEGGLHPYDVMGDVDQSDE